MKQSNVSPNYGAEYVNKSSRLKWNIIADKEATSSFQNLDKKARSGNLKSSLWKNLGLHNSCEMITFQE